MELKFEGKRKYSLCDFSLNKTGLKKRLKKNESTKHREAYARVTSRVFTHPFPPQPSETTTSPVLEVARNRRGVTRSAGAAR